MTTERSLATLTGSEKQVAWAETIRAEKFAGFARVIANQEDSIEQAQINVETGGDPARRLYPAIAVLEKMIAMLDFLASETQATTWIDSRNRTSAQLLCNGLVRS
jgi:hypothetical protein